MANPSAPKNQRKRKTKDPCPQCFLNRDLCICHLFLQLNLKTRLCLIIHAKELKRTTNTGRLAIHCLTNSELRIRGETPAALDLSDLLTENYRSVLFYPAEGAQELNADFLNQDPRPIQLIVPDGNWRQASKVHYRHPELREIPRVMIKAANQSTHHLRAESSPEGMATLQAIAVAMGIIEGHEVQQKLMEVYNAKLAATLKGRGIIIS